MSSSSSFFFFQACENALSCIQKNSRADAQEIEHFETAEIVEKIKTFKDCATALTASRSGMSVLLCLVTQNVKVFRAQDW